MVVRNRKLIPIDDNVLEQISNVARRLSMSPTDFVNMVLNNLIMITSNRSDVIDAIFEIPIYANLKYMKGLFIPSTLFIDIINSIDETAFKSFIERLHDVVKKIAILTKFRSSTPAVQLVKLLISVLVPVLNVDIVKHSDKSRIIVSLDQTVPCSERMDHFLKTVIEALIEGLDMESQTTLLGQDMCIYVLEIRGG